MPNENENIDAEDRVEDEIGESDIVFECEHCGKSFVIEAKGAGMLIQCPDCRHDVRVPVPEEAAGAGGDADLESESPAPVENGDGAALPEPENLFMESGGIEDDDSIPDQEKIAVMSAEIEELRARRRYLEKKRADHARIFQNLARQVAMLQTAVSQLADFLKIAQESAENTQELE